LSVKFPVSLHDSIMSRLKQAEEQSDGEEDAESIKRISSFWLNAGPYLP
jgi:hypothetical protein